MKFGSCSFLILSIFILNPSNAALSYNDAVKKKNSKLVKSMAEKLALKPDQVTTVEKILQAHPVISQGNPEVSQYALSKESCLANKVNFENSEFLEICKAPYMAPLYDPTTQKIGDAKVCIDQFEFPSIPCEYPLVWTKSMQAAELCASVGKRLCDAHEWEGACAGQLTPADYQFSLIKSGMSMSEKHKVLRDAHNPKRKILWSYGPKKDHKLCATGSKKSSACSMNSHKGEWNSCGSNIYPAGSFPQCKSSLAVYDLHGNIAEQMNIPFAPEELASKGGLGYTEMKGSWYIFSSYEAHIDDCRWRAPFWHGASIQKSADQHNHLGFRCCKSL